MRFKTDYLIIGAGFSGLVAAERLCNKHGAKCIVVDRRNHIGGNAYDKYDEAGVLIHAYGPHYFRTNSPRIVEYLSQFTDWHKVDYKILACVRGKFLKFPINLNTFEQMLGRASTTEEMEKWLEANRKKIDNPTNCEDAVLSQVGTVLYERFFKGYTTKQWNRPPRELDASICMRVPVRTNRDDRYLREDFQALPKDGYTRLMERIIESCGNRLTLKLETEYKSFYRFVDFKHMIYTGPVDEFYDYRFDPLPYRSLRFEHKSFSKRELTFQGKTNFWQPAVQVNYPGNEPFTRIVETKHITGQQCDATTIVREFSQDYIAGRERYYPMPVAEAKAQYARYKVLTEMEEKVSFIGRLATYRYYNMDQVIGMALSICDREIPPGKSAICLQSV